MNILPITPLTARRKHYVNAGPPTQEPLLQLLLVGGSCIYQPVSCGINEGRGHFRADVAAHPGAVQHHPGDAKFSASC